MVFFISLCFVRRLVAGQHSNQDPSLLVLHFFPTWVALSMYEAYWGLDKKPFENTPDPRFLFRSDDLQDLYTRLLYTLSSRHGAALISGDSGCGKTMMARALLHEMDPDKTEIALLSNPCRTAEEFLREILYQLGEDGDQLDRARLVHRIHEIIYEAYSNGRETVVVVDEAQSLEDAEIFEEIRLLLNLQLDDAFLITVLLVGQPQLPERLRKHPALDQRIATRGFLRPFDEPTVSDYVAHRLRVAGRREPVFTAEALKLVSEYSKGIPRKINNLCDIALVIGYSRKLGQVDGDWMARLIQAERGDGA
ncbi:MAG: AAA family ATPase [bacterium]|nr:AAA family ATPase [bacterium]